MFGKNVASDRAGSRAYRLVSITDFEHSQEARTKDKIREAAGHNQTLVVGDFRQRNHRNARVARKLRSQATRNVAGQYKMTYLRNRIQDMRERASALRTVAGTRNRNHKGRPARRQTLAAVRQNHATTNPLHRDPELRLQWNPHTVARIFRTS
jgi:hypothetical protein